MLGNNSTVNFCTSTHLNLNYVHVLLRLAMLGGINFIVLLGNFASVIMCSSYRVS